MRRCSAGTRASIEPSAGTRVEERDDGRTRSWTLAGDGRFARTFGGTTGGTFGGTTVPGRRGVLGDVVVLSVDGSQGQSFCVLDAGRRSWHAPLTGRSAVRR